MNINLTLIIQILIFSFFVYFTAKFIWPSIMNIIEERNNKILDGLSLAERNKKELHMSRLRIQEDMKLSKQKSEEILRNAEYQALEIIKLAKQNAEFEAKKQYKIIKKQLDLDINNAKNTLYKEISKLSCLIAEKIVLHEINEETHKKLINLFIKNNKLC